ncbi:MAG: type IV pilus twitching motility protein PilT [Proteobacteria bacterium]|nr:type IV pilus twitching motility protein PilT [Pseudomonadota bacterium]
MSLQEMLRLMIAQNGSDLHITTGSSPRIRVNGELMPMEDVPPLTGVETRQMCYTVLTDAQKHKFEESSELDFSFGLKSVSRFRGNLFIQRGSVAGVFRSIPFEIKNFHELGLPPVVETLCKRRSGLVLVTGPTGSGKSTTLASIIDRINEEQAHHIITIEDPIEYLHNSKMSLVNQREVGADTESFHNALRYILRQDPDVVLLGELRDMETIATALAVADTGHLCFATLHTNNCVQTVNRIVDMFPAHQQPQVRAQLSFVLEGVLSQTLAVRAGGTGRVMALEVMIPNAAIRNLIREDKIHQIYSQMQIGQAKYGMQTMNQALLDLYLKNTITIDEAMGRTQDMDDMRQMLSNAGAGGAMGGGGMGAGAKPGMNPMRPK